MILSLGKFLAICKVCVASKYITVKLVLAKVDLLYLGCSLLLCRQAGQTRSKETLCRNQMLQYSCGTLVTLGALVTGTALSVSAMRLTSVPCSISTDTLTAEQDQ